jgi:DNA-binding CsgD family transcriptional regulator
MSDQLQSPEEAVASWRALVAGRWAVVDHFDHDGRRYLVAVRSDESPRAALSVVEKQTLTLLARGCSSKLAAYQLGVAPSTIATRLASARRKLGTKTRVETIRIWKGSGGDS